MNICFVVDDNRRTIAGYDNPLQAIFIARIASQVGRYGLSVAYKVTTIDTMNAITNESGVKDNG